MFGYFCSPLPSKLRCTELKRNPIAQKDCYILGRPCAELKTPCRDILILKFRTPPAPVVTSAVSRQVVRAARIWCCRNGSSSKAFNNTQMLRLFLGRRDAPHRPASPVSPALISVIGCYFFERFRPTSGGPRFIPVAGAEGCGFRRDWASGLLWNWLGFGPLFILERLKKSKHVFNNFFIIILIIYVNKQIVVNFHLQYFLILSMFFF